MFRTVISLTALGFLVSISTAAAQTPLCTERSSVINQLSDEYSEKPVAMGIANNGGVLEILSSRTGQSWTIILTMPNGMTCMVAAGESWERLPVISLLDPAA